MDVAIVGGHGQVGRLLTRRLVAAGDDVRALARGESQLADVEDDGATGVLHDLEADGVDALAARLEGVDAVVFAAGAGPDSGPEGKWVVDFRGAVTTLRAARSAGVDRYVMLSVMGTDDPPTDDEAFSVYLRAKAFADAELRASDLDWTIVRPGRLTDDDASDRVSLARHVEQGEIARDDVAAVLAACLHESATTGHVLELVGGEETVAESVAAVVSGAAA